MKARPILFSAPMVRALLAGTKTQTRRVVKGAPPADFVDRVSERGQPQFLANGPAGTVHAHHGIMLGEVPRCPYGAPGDLLWVRENLARELSEPYLMYDADNCSLSPRNSEKSDWCYLQAEKRFTVPSIHMPRWASRLTLRMTDVRVQRLQDISEEDAKAEGAEKHNSPAEFLTTHRMGFRKLWESINGPGSWNANPWAWALTFEVIKKNVDEVLKEST